MPTVMVVDDTDAARKIMSRLLQRAGYRTVCAGNGREALNVIEASTPDLVLLDVCMPEVDGLALLQILHQHPRWKSLPVIIMSGISDIRSLARAKELGAKDYLIKARYTWQEMLVKLKEHLGNAQ